jgi:hypothetical protein
MCSQNAGNAISETQLQPPLDNSCLLYSAHTFGDRILCWGEGKENGPFGTTTEQSLKNALKLTVTILTHLFILFQHIA